MKSSSRFIVVGVDGSESSKCALRWAAAQAVLTGVSLRVVTAWHVPAAAYGPMPMLAGCNLSLETEQVLHETITEVLGDCPVVDIQPLVVEGPVTLELLRAAKGAELLVVGSTGHGTLTGMILGSTGEHCIAHAPCPVVVVERSLARV